MKSKILRIAILIVFLLFVFEGYSQISAQLNQLKGAEIIIKKQADSPEEVVQKNQDAFVYGFADKLALTDSKRFLLKSSFKESQNYSETDLVYQRMEWEIDPNIRYISGCVTSYFTSQVEHLTEIEFDLNDTMRVDSVIHNKQKVSFSQNENKILIELSHPLKIMDLDSVQVFYQGEPENTGYFVKQVHAGTPIIWTFSEPYGAMEWWPCKQSLLDKIDSIDIIVTSPDSFRTASNGILVSDVVENGSRMMHWKHRHPIATYLIAIAVTNYAEYSDWLDLEDGRKIQILNYVYPENLETAKTQTPITADFIQLYNQLFGEYPFANEKYGHAQWGAAGAMEHQTMGFMYDFNFGVVAHELAHQWFGDYITCGSWHDIWLNEGFATYLAGLAYENLDNKNWLDWKQSYISGITSAPDGSVYVKDSTNLNDIFSGRLSYAKGAFILHMLRWILGDEDFFKGMKSYFNDPEIANGFALSGQFIEYMETAGNTSLTEFFKDWLYGEGYPAYSVGYTVENDSIVKLTLSQSPSHNSVDFFEMPVPIRISNIENTAYKDFRLVHTGNNQEFTVKIGFKLGKVEVDPDRWLISKTLKIIDDAPVKDAYVKLVDKVSGKALPNTTLTYYGITIKSDANGFGVIKNFRNVTFSYSANNTRYFYDEGTINLNPGDTAVIALTSKNAKVEFILKDNSGTVANQTLIFNGSTVTTNEEGSVVIRNVAARKKYQYSIEDSLHKAIQDSIYIELDTVIYIMLEQINTYAENLASSDFDIYPNPFDKELTIQTKGNREYSVELATITGRIIYQAKIEGNFHRINLRELSNGLYFVRMKSDNFISIRKVIKIE